MGNVASKRVSSRNYEARSIEEAIAKVDAALEGIRFDQLLEAVGEVLPEHPGSGGA
jgi:hypothetical protein